MKGIWDFGLGGACKYLTLHMRGLDLGPLRWPM